MTETKENEVIEADFVQKKTGNRWKVEEGNGVPKFLRDMATFSKKEGIKSALVLLLDEHNNMYNMPLLDNEHHAALFYIHLDDIKQDLRSELMGEYEEEV